MKRTEVRASMFSKVPALEPPPPARSITLRPYRAAIWPLAFSTALAALSAIPLVAQNPRLFWSFLGTAGALLLWDTALLTRTTTRGRALTVEFVLKKQHYIQACVQGSILLYWGWY